MRLGKRERQLRKQQWDQYREVKAQVISSNLADQYNQVKSVIHPEYRLGFKASPATFKGMTHKGFSSGWVVGSKTTGKAKSTLSDADLYTQRPVTKGGSKAECMVRTGTTPPRKLVTVDKATGDRVFMRIGAKPVFKPVGLPGSVPERRK